MNERTPLVEEIERAESLLLQGQYEAADELLARLAADVEEYVSVNCQATDELQWFSFPSLFERLAYRRVEGDPRELRDVGEPFDRLYGDLGLAEVQLGDYDAASRALAQAVRWNPMGCEHRLNLAELYRVAGDMDEYLALSFSVFERASDPTHLARAFVNFSAWFEASQNPRAAAAALHAARNLRAQDGSVDAALELARGTDHDPDLLSDAETRDVLAAEGLPDGANAEIAVCLLMCAIDAAEAGNRNLATKLVLRSRELVGEQATKALLELIHESDADDTDDATGDAPAEGGERDA
jgi:tetratricopeptide (TPR) repeat protein